MLEVNEGPRDKIEAAVAVEVSSRDGSGTRAGGGGRGAGGVVLGVLERAVGVAEENADVMAERLVRRRQVVPPVTIEVGRDHGMGVVVRAVPDRREEGWHAAVFENFEARPIPG